MCIDFYGRPCIISSVFLNSCLKFYYHFELHEMLENYVILATVVQNIDVDNTDQIERSFTYSFIDNLLSPIPVSNLLSTLHQNFLMNEKIKR